MEANQIAPLDENRIPLKDKRVLRCAIYTRKSSDEGLEQEFNSLDAQRESCEAYILSQKREGWLQIPDHYDDGGYSGGNMERPGLKKLLADIEKGWIDVVVVYKIDRLSRSILDFTKMIDWFEKKNVLFSAVTQKVSTTDASGRMNLNILISFSQYEREIAGERIRDKLAAAKRKGKYCGGIPVLGYDVNPERTKILVNHAEAQTVQYIFKRYLQIRSLRRVAQDLNEQGIRTKEWTTKKGMHQGGIRWDVPQVYRVIKNRKYIGQVVHKDKHYPGEHEAIIDEETWQAVQNSLGECSEDKSKVVRIRTVSPLRGVIRCSHCDCAMVPTYTSKYNGRRYCYYICTKDSKRGVSECPLQRIPAADIEKAVVQQLGGVFRSKVVVQGVWEKARQMEGIEVDRLRDQRSALLADLPKLEEEHLLLLKAPGNKDKEIREIQSRIKDIKSRGNEFLKRVQALEQVATTQASIEAAFETMDTFWDSLYPVEQQRIIDLLVQVVEIGEEGLRLVMKTSGMEELISSLAAFSCDKKQRSK